jgi:hypothetical protein
MGSSVNEYSKHVLNDQDKFQINSMCPMHTRGCGVHNYLLNNNKWRKKYKLIKNGDRVKYYYCSANIMSENVFAYLPGNFPIEFAPNIDYNTQFQKCIIDPFNRFLTAMKYEPLQSELIVKKALF